jgi:hypothetical protein
VLKHPQTPLPGGGQVLCIREPQPRLRSS